MLAFRCRTWRSIFHALKTTSCGCDLTQTQRRALTDVAVADPGWGPVGLVMRGLDVVQNTTHLPWWAMIATTAVALRITLLPLTIKQIQSSQTTAFLISNAIRAIRLKKRETKLSSRDALDVLQNVRNLIQFPWTHHPRWTFVAPLIQIPLFVICVMAVRRMCTLQWPGLNEGGILWFKDLTQSAFHFSDLSLQMGAAGAALPIAITLSYLTHLQLVFRESSPSDSIQDSLRKVFKLGMEWLSIPVLIVTFQLPHGALVYWLTSSLYSVSQSVLLNNERFRRSLQLPIAGAKHSEEGSEVSSEKRSLRQKLHFYREQKNVQAVIDVAQEILKDHPKDGFAHFAKGEAHSNLNQWEAALESFQNSLENETEPKVIAIRSLSKGFTEIMLHKYASAEIDLQHALKLDPKNILIFIALFRLYKQSGNVEKLKNVLKQGTEMDPRFNDYLKNL